MTERVVLPENIGAYEIGELIESGWGWDVYEAYTTPEEGEGIACHLRVFFNQPENGLLHSRLREAQQKLTKHSHLHVQAIKNVVHVELPSRVPVLLVEEELLKEWSAPKPSEYRAVMLQLLAAVEHLYLTGLPGIGLSGSNLARTRNGKAVLANLSSNWEQLWAGRSRVGESDFYLRLPPESASHPEEFNEPQWVWSAGSLLVEALSGMLPTVAACKEEDVFDTPISTYVNHLTDDFRESQLVTLPEDIQDVLRTALAKNPEDRYPSLSAFSGALETPIKTGKVGDRYVIPTASAVQELSAPPSSTAPAYFVGIGIFLIACLATYYFVVVVPDNQEGATLVGSGPGVILEPNTKWDVLNPPETEQAPDVIEDDVVTLPDESEVEEVGLDSGVVKDPSSTDQEVVEAPHVQADIEPEKRVVEEPAAIAEDLMDEPMSEPEGVQEKEPEQVVESEDLRQAVTVVSEPDTADQTAAESEDTDIHPDSVEVKQEQVETAAAEPESDPEPEVNEPQKSPIDRLLTENLSWQEGQPLLSQFIWRDAKRRERKRLVKLLDEWVPTQIEFIANAATQEDRLQRLTELQDFWKAAPLAMKRAKPSQSIQKQLDEELRTFVVNVKNQTEFAVSVYTSDKNRLAEVEPGDSAQLRFNQSGKKVSLLAEGKSERNQLTSSFAVAPGGYAAWAIDDIPTSMAIIVPKFEDGPGGLEVTYAPKGSAEVIPLTGIVEVDPGDYSFFFRRPDFYPIKKVLRFSKASRRYGVSLPSESSWVPQYGLAKLLEWEALAEKDPERVYDHLRRTNLELQDADHQRRLQVLTDTVAKKKAEEEQKSIVSVEVIDLGNLVPPVSVHIRGGSLDDEKTFSVGDSLDLSVGEYELRFTRPDHAAITRDWQVEPSLRKEELLVPTESDWSPSPALQKLRALERAVEESDSRNVVKLIQELRRKPLEWEEHQKQYDNLRGWWYRRAAGQ